MRSGAAAIVLLMLVTFPAAPQPALKMLTPDELREDFAILRQTLEDAHATIYRYTPKPELDAAFDDTARRLGQPMTDFEFFRRVLPLVDRLHDAHTLLNPSRESLRNVGRYARVFPLDVRYRDGRAYVERNFSEDASVPLGAEVLSINGQAMGELTETVLAARSTDGYNRNSRYEQTNFTFWLYYYELICDTDVFDVLLRDAAGAT